MKRELKQCIFNTSLLNYALKVVFCTFSRVFFTSLRISYPQMPVNEMLCLRIGRHDHFKTQHSVTDNPVLLASNKKPPQKTSLQKKALQATFTKQLVSFLQSCYTGCTKLTKWKSLEDPLRKLSIARYESFVSTCLFCFAKHQLRH